MTTLLDTPTLPTPDRSAPKKAISAGQLVAALPGAVRKLGPRLMWRNPVMFIVEIGALLTTVLAVAEPFLGGPADSGGSAVPGSFTVGIAVWLWLTVIFANLAEAAAEGRGKAQADSLRQTRTSTSTSTSATRVLDYNADTNPGAAGSPVQAIVGRPHPGRHRDRRGRRARSRRR